jgi:glutathione S-transferase
MLEDSKTPYENTSDNLYGPTGTMLCFRGTPENIKVLDNTVFPVFFPPAIHHTPADGGEEVIINQVPACMQYIGRILGYTPVTPAEQARADCVLLNANDYIAEGRRTFHPTKDSMSYKDQQEEGDKVSKEWTESRMLMWLAYFDKICSKNSPPNSPIAGGPNVTYADFALFHVLDATVFQFDNEKYNYAWTKADISALKEYYEWMRQRPNLQAYFASDRCPKFAGDSMM